MNAILLAIALSAAPTTTIMVTPAGQTLVCGTPRSVDGSSHTVRVCEPVKRTVRLTK